MVHTGTLAMADMVILVVYFSGMIGLGFWLARRNAGAEDYFLAGRRMIWPFIGLSLFASNLSSTTLIGLSGDAYASGISVYSYEWMAALILVVFAMLFLPLLLRARVYTMPEFLYRRFDGRARVYLSALTLFLNLVVDTAGSLYAGALVVKMVFPELPLWQIIGFVAVIAGLYTITGGLAAVIFTDAAQALLLILGATIITVIGLDKVGGFDAVLAQVPADKLSLIRPLDDPTLPWLGLVTGVPLLGFYYWATNQTIVQRSLAAKSLDHGRWGALFAGLLKLAPLFIMVLPGTVAILLYPELPRADLVFPTLMFDLLPTGLLGLTLAGFIAAIMSSIDSALNSASTLVTMDFIRPRHPELDSRRLMQIGRLVMALFMLFAVLWAPQIAHFPSLFQYLQITFSYLVPPVVVLFVFGVFWPRANAKGAMATIVIGLVTGLALFVIVGVLELMELHFLYVAPVVFAASSVAMVVGSFAGPPPERAAIASCIWSPQSVETDEETARKRPALANPWLLSGLLASLTAGVVYIFR